jgi:DNA-binding transcriptional regulator YdaS (Cro superfamily)
MVKHRKLMERAVELAGSQAKLAEGIGLSQQGVSFLINQATKVSAETAIAIERFTEGKIRRGDLRPDIWENA